ncbi:unnamed protein product, partial [Mesorhabditis belari]|uniref:Uncharacterized protein n=1 Tax=Mesorhabditis belari TaxID=2138241 RepID=A0AAF3J430_9BILA
MDSSKADDETKPKRERRERGGVKVRMKKEREALRQAGLFVPNGHSSWNRSAIGLPDNYRPYFDRNRHDFGPHSRFDDRGYDAPRSIWHDQPRPIPRMGFFTSNFPDSYSKRHGMKPPSMKDSSNEPPGYSFFDSGPTTSRKPPASSRVKEPLTGPFPNPPMINLITGRSMIPPPGSLKLQDSDQHLNETATTTRDLNQREVFGRMVWKKLELIKDQDLLNHVQIGINRIIDRAIESQFAPESKKQETTDFTADPTTTTHDDLFQSFASQSTQLSSSSSSTFNQSESKSLP